MEQQENELEQARREIDAVDAQLAALFERRMAAQTVRQAGYPLRRSRRVPVPVRPWVHILLYGSDRPFDSQIPSKYTITGTEKQQGLRRFKGENISNQPYEKRRKLQRH